MFPARRHGLPRLFFTPPDDDWDYDRPEPDEIDDDYSLDLNDEYWDALLLDDDYEPHPEPGDFWPDQHAA